MTDLIIGNLYQNKSSNQIRVLDICNDYYNKPKVVLYKKKKNKKVIKPFQDVLTKTLKGRK